MQAELMSSLPGRLRLDRAAEQSVIESIAGRAADADTGTIDLSRDIKALRDAGYLIAPLPASAGGCDWGLASDGVRPLCDFLRALGRANLSVARLYEGHVNAVKLIWLYGTRSQQSDLFEKVRRANAFMGVWGADGPEPVTILDENREGRTRLSGGKRFASGLGLVTHAIVTARGKDGSQLLALAVDDPARMDHSTWRTAGMRATASGSFDFNGMPIDEMSLIGSPNDYQREPHFEGGVWRYAARQTAALHRHPGNFYPRGMRQMQTERSARFDALYTENPDPWDYLTSDYERQKYDATLAALPRPLYRQGLEIGCSIGVLSRRLALRCEQMLAVDISSVAIERARSLGELPANLTFKRCDVPHEWPSSQYDLIALSEILYFLDEDEIDLLAERLARDLETNGHCIIVNWTGDTETAAAGQKATAKLKEALSPHRACTTLIAHKMEKYTLELLEIS